MKRIKLLALIVLTAMLVCACGKKEEEVNSGGLGEPLNPESSVSDIQESEPSAPETEEPSDEAPETVVDDSVPPAEGMVRSRLTNEWVDADVANTRPIAIMTPNEANAIPQYNLSKASVIYEALVEGSMTRMLAIYEDWEDLDKIGNVRSFRLYYGYWALEWDAFIIHVGGPKIYVDEFLARSDVEDLDEDNTAFFRSTDRKAPHNCYVSGSGVKKAIDNKGWSLSYRGKADENHYKFTSKSEPNTLSQYSNAVTANKVDLTSCYPVTRCYFEYNEDDGLYYRYQHLSGSTDGPHIDGATGDQLAFKNLLVQNTYYENLDANTYKAFQVHDSNAEGWYFTNGKGIHVTWKKDSDYGATRYYDDNGDEITLNTGKTMVLIIGKDDKVSYQ